MAQNDSVRRDLDKKTRTLSQQQIKPGDGLFQQQIAQNQLQAIQNEQRNNLSQARLQAQTDQQAQAIAAQAAQISTMESGPAVETLKKYGLNKPRIVKTEKHDIKIAPPNITINNTTNNTTNNGGGPLAGRELAFKQPQQANSTNKFKSWLSGLLLSQKEANAKRERDFDKRESALVRSSNKMLKRIEAAGKDISTNLNPKVIGTTVGNQFRILLMLFLLRFLSKHWDKVLTVLDGIGKFIGRGLDYFGITNRQKGQAAPFYRDLLAFFAAKPEEKSLFQVFARLGSELIDYLRLKLDNAMKIRGEALKNIKFPEIDTNNLAGTLSNIAEYVGNILTAIMDPKKGVQNGIRSSVRSTMSAIVRDDAKERIHFDDEVKGQGLDDTSYGDYAAEKRRTLSRSALTATGGLVNNTSATISQGRDLLGALDAARNGDIDIARFGGGLQRLQDVATSKGHVTMDKTTIDQLFGNKLIPLLNSKDIVPVQMKYVRVKKTDADYANENADPKSATINGWLVGKALDATDMDTPLTVGTTLGGAAAGAAIGGVVGAVAGGGLGWAYGAIKGSPGANAALEGTKSYLKKHLYSDDYILKLVPQSDPRPGVPLDGITTRTFYQVTPAALNELARVLTNNAEGVTEINSGSEKFMTALNQYLISRVGGGKDRVRSTDYDIEKGYESIRHIENLETVQQRREKASPFRQSMRTIGNNGLQLINDVCNGIGSAINTVGEFINSFSQGNSNQIYNWLWGGTAPKWFDGPNSANARHASSLMTRVTVPIHDFNGQDSVHTLVVHKYLANDVKSIFTEIYQRTNFQIDPEQTGAFNYRPINNKKYKVNSSGQEQLSPHSYGCCIDVNWSINYLGDTKTINTNRHLGTKSHPVVQIFYRHSWKWLGRDATNGFADPMHFEYAGKAGAVSGENGRLPEGFRMSVATTQDDIRNQQEVAAINASYYSSSGGEGYMSFTAGTFAGPSGIDQTSSWEDATLTGTLAYKNNNPGNRMGTSKYGTGTRKASGNREFTTFATMSDGFAGNADLIIKYLNGEKGPGKRNPTVREIINSWSSGNNEQYIQNVAQWTGLGTDNPVALTYDNVLKLNRAIARQDGGIIRKEDSQTGTSLAFKDFLNEGGQPDLYQPPINGNVVGNLLEDVGGYMMSTELLDTRSPEEIQIDNERAEAAGKAAESWGSNNYLQWQYTTADDYVKSYLEMDSEQRAQEDKRARRVDWATRFWDKIVSKEDKDHKGEDIAKIIGNGILDRREFATKVSMMSDDSYRAYYNTVRKRYNDYYRRKNSSGKSLVDLKKEAGLEDIKLPRTKERMEIIPYTGDAYYVNSDSEYVLRLLEGDEVGARELLYDDNQLSAHNKAITANRHKDILSQLKAEKEEAQKAYEQALRYKEERLWSGGKTKGRDYLQNLQNLYNSSMSIIEEEKQKNLEFIVKELQNLGWNYDLSSLDSTTFDIFRSELDKRAAFAKHKVDFAQSKIDSVGDLDSQRDERTVDNAAQFDETTNELDRLNLEYKNLEEELWELRHNPDRNIYDESGIFDEFNRELELKQKQLDLNEKIKNKVIAANSSLKTQREELKKTESVLGQKVEEIEKEYFDLLVSGKDFNSAIKELTVKYGEDVGNYLNHLHQNMSGWSDEAIKKFSDWKMNWQRDWNNRISVMTAMAAAGLKDDSPAEDIIAWDIQNLTYDIDPVTGFYRTDENGKFIKVLKPEKFTVEGLGIGKSSANIGFGFNKKKNDPFGFRAKLFSGLSPSTPRVELNPSDSQQETDTSRAISLLEGIRDNTATAAVASTVTANKPISVQPASPPTISYDFPTKTSFGRSSFL